MIPSLFVPFLVKINALVKGLNFIAGLINQHDVDWQALADKTLGIFDVMGYGSNLVSFYVARYSTKADSDERRVIDAEIAKFWKEMDPSNSFEGAGILTFAAHMLIHALILTLDYVVEASTGINPKFVDLYDKFKSAMDYTVIPHLFKFFGPSVSGSWVSAMAVSFLCSQRKYIKSGVSLVGSGVSLVGRALCRVPFGTTQAVESAVSTIRESFRASSGGGTSTVLAGRATPNGEGSVTLSPQMSGNGEPDLEEMKRQILELGQELTDLQSLVRSQQALQAEQAQPQEAQEAQQALDGKVQKVVETMGLMGRIDGLDDRVTAISGALDAQMGAINTLTRTVDGQQEQIGLVTRLNHKEFQIAEGAADGLPQSAIGDGVAATLEGVGSE